MKLIENNYVNDIIILACFKKNAKKSYKLNSIENYKRHGTILIQE